MKKMKICQIYYDASHYRYPIYSLTDKYFDTDFVFGIPPSEGILQMDTSSFKGNVKYTKIYKWKKFFFQAGVLSLVWKKYDIYLGMGEVYSLSTWLFPILIRIFHPHRKVFFWSHGWYGKESKTQSFIKRLFFKLPNGGTFVYGHYAKNLMIMNGISAEKIFVIHNSLAYDEQLKLRKSKLESDVYLNHFKNSNNNLIFIGRLTPVKKLDMILEAMALLRENGFKLNLTLIGDGEERTRLENLSKQLGLENNVWFYGSCYDEDKNAELVYNADLCVAPGNIGLTAMHVLMFGCPAITHNEFQHQMPEFEAITANVTGDFFESNNVNSLADTIKQWLENHHDRDSVRSACYHEIDTQWNPEFQIKVLKKHLK